MGVWAWVCGRVPYMMGGKTNIMDEPRMPPLTEPTTPMSSKREVRKAMKASSSAEMRRTPTGGG